MSVAVPDTIRAWSVADYGSADDLALIERHVPSLSAHEVLVEVEAAALNPLDLKLISGEMRSFMPLNFPFVPGSDVCGTVVATGDAVDSVSIGDRILAMAPRHGVMASHVVCAIGPALARAPAMTQAAELAALPEAGMTALSIVRAARNVEGRRVCIIGATGGIGLLLCQLFAHAGANVIATASAADRQTVLRAGARETIDHHLETVADGVARLTPNGADVVVDLVNQFDALLDSARSVKSGGRLISTLLGPDAAQFPDGVEAIYIRLAPEPGDLERLVDELAAGRLDTNVRQRFSFHEVPDAYRALRDGHVVGKIVVTAQ